MPRRDSSEEVRIMQTEEGATTTQRSYHERLGADWLTRSLIAALCCVVWWYGRELRADQKAIAESMEAFSQAFSTRVSALEIWQASVTADRYTVKDARTDISYHQQQHDRDRDTITASLADVQSKLGTIGVDVARLAATMDAERDARRPP